MKKLILFLCLLASTVQAEEPQTTAEAPVAPSYRSSADARFFIGPKVGILGTSSGFGTQTGVQATYLFGRCGVIVDYHEVDIDYFDPAHERNYIFGAGATCRVIGFGHKRKFWQGTRLMVKALAETGKSNYLVWDHYSNNQRFDIAGGSTSGTGFSTGAEFYFPLWMGAWATASLGGEAMSFNYDNVPSRADGSHVTQPGSGWFYWTIGIEYGL